MRAERHDDEDGRTGDVGDLTRRIQRIEERYRTLIDNVDVGICIAKMKFDENDRAIDYRIVDGNAAYERHTGLQNSIGKWVSEFAPDLERHWFDTYGHVALTGESVQFENGAVPLGNRWFEVEAHRVGDPRDHEVAILFTDITARRAAEERQRTVNHEMSHRMKNFSAIIQAIVMQTLRKAGSIEQARATIGDRLEAFGRAQDILLASAFGNVEIATVISDAIAPYQTVDGRIAISGTPHSIPAQQALYLSLAMHELATNAAKYGALSGPEGKVDISWSSDGKAFGLVWQESAGPAVLPPSVKGFGSRLLEEIVPQTFSGSALADYARSGLRYTLSGVVAPD